MSKRPPSRPANRKPGTAQRFRPDVAAGVDPGEAVAQTPGPGAQPPLRATSSREDFSRLLDTMKAQGNISAADEAAILREYDALLAELRAEKTRLEALYRERITADGQAQADEWLAGEAAALGRKQGEQLRQLVETIPALAPIEPTG